jgi:hypothetical protein
VVAGVAVRVLAPVFAEMFFGFPRCLHIDRIRWLVGAVEAVEVNVAVTRVDAGDLDRLSGLGIVLVDDDGESFDIINRGFARDGEVVVAVLVGAKRVV